MASEVHCVVCVNLGTLFYQGLDDFTPNYCIVQKHNHHIINFFASPTISGIPYHMIDFRWPCTQLT